MTAKQQRLPRFKRAPEVAGSFQFTPRDLELIRHVAEHRFIKSEWLIKLVGGSRQQILRRLNLLYHHGYLERPRCQLDYYHQGGSKSLVYGLASRGAGRLRRDLNMPFERMDWTTRNKRVGRLFLEHTLMISDFMAALEQECRSRNDVRLIYGNDLVKPHGCKFHREPFRWTVDIPGKARVVVVPDKVFALDTTLTDGVVRTHYFLEADRGTMPVCRSSQKSTSLKRKLQAYRRMGSKGIQPKNEQSWLAVITTSQERISRLRHLEKSQGQLSILSKFAITRATPFFEVKIKRHRF
jgi:hypothetical protein